MNWFELFQGYFNITDEHIYSNGETSTEYTVKDEPINIKGHCYEKKLDIHSDVELNGVEFIEHLTDDSSTPVHYVSVKCVNGDGVFFEMEGDEAFLMWDLSLF